LPHSTRSSRVWWVRPADPFPPRPFSCRGFRSSTGEDEKEGDDGTERPLRPTVEPPGDRGWVVARSLLRVCGTAVLAVAVIAVLRSFWRTPKARPVENPSSFSSRPAADPAPRILALEVRNFPADGRPDDPDEIDLSSWENPGDDVTWVLARLDPPAYCYLIAFDPDGQFRLADPPDVTEPPSRRSEICYAPASRSSRGASYPRGAGMQAWLLVAASTPLPPFADWPAARRLRWRSVQAEGVWRFDGHSIERIQAGDHRVLERMFESPRPFAQLCASLTDIPDIDAIEAITYPVRPDLP
jgi:hypothetical protein